MIERLRRMGKALKLMADEPLPDYAICDSCSGFYTDYNKHIKYCEE